jgi:hypothetical protein
MAAMKMIQNRQFCVYHGGLCHAADPAPNGGTALTHVCDQC